MQKTEDLIEVPILKSFESFDADNAVGKLFLESRWAELLSTEIAHGAAPRVLDVAVEDGQLCAATLQSRPTAKPVPARVQHIPAGMPVRKESTRARIIHRYKEMSVEVEFESNLPPSQFEHQLERVFALAIESVPRDV